MKSRFSFKGIIIGIFSLFIFGTLSLPVDENIMTPEKIIRMKRISDPQLSPDGQRIAYILRHLDEMKLGFTSDIFIVDTKTAEKIQLTYDPGNDSSPRWSPDGSKIAFLSNRSGKNQIWLISKANDRMSRKLFKVRHYFVYNPSRSICCNCYFHLDQWFQ